MKKKAIWTLDDIDTRHQCEDTRTAPENRGSAKTYHPSENIAPLSCFHIPTLPNSDSAKSMLQRVVREFTPIVHRRGYHVTFVSEMCCCGDGLDFSTHKRRRRGRRMGSNVWGYNQTSFGGGRSKHHEIHLRLRRAASHGNLHDYEDVAGTLAHELAHCEHGPHNEHFYKLMDEILEEHATLMASSMTHQDSSVPAFGGTGQALGGRVVSRRGVPSNSRLLLPGKCVGGDKSFTQYMTPREAAVAAAEARRRQQQMRLRGNNCCVVELLDSDEEEEGTTKQAAIQRKKKSRGANTGVVPARDVCGLVAKNQSSKTTENEGASRRAAKERHSRAVAASPLPATCIDLTIDDGDRDIVTSSTAPRQPVSLLWSCRRCTFRNSGNTLTCEMCRALQPHRIE